jgi:SAM-dependent methyltransferase
LNFRFHDDMAQPESAPEQAIIPCAPESQHGLRSLVIEKYSSTSDGTHRPIAAEWSARQSSAFKYYLRGLIPQPARGPWLDLGCGQGLLLRFATQQGYDHVLGVDASEEMLASARQAGMPVQFADVFQWLAEAPSQQWAVVSAFDFLEHFSREQGFDLLRHIRRILAPDGVCLLQMPNAASPWSYGMMASDLTHETAYSPSSISQLAKLAGFAHCEVRELGPPPGTFFRQIRRALWFGLRSAYRFANLVETGTAGGGVYTRVMLAKLSGERG